jgi:Tol biopolymer transport system component
VAHINIMEKWIHRQEAKLIKHAYLFVISLVVVACTNQTRTPHDGLVLGVIRTVLNIPDNYVVSSNGDGGIQMQLPANLNSDPEWSPDGKWIISSTQYQVGQPEDSEIYLMRSDGSERSSVAHNSGGSFDPAWSPNNSRVAYYARDSRTGIYILNIQCVQQLGQHCDLRATFLTSGDSSPDWSPDGSQIAYEKGGNIFEIDSEGKEQPANITPKMKYCHDPKWSPDGTKILFSCYQLDHFDVFVEKADGSDLIDLTQGQGSNTRPRWSPDGSKITFISDRNGLGKIIGMQSTIRSSAIFIMDSDGTNVVRLSLRDDEHVLWFAWLPPS